MRLKSATRNFRFPRRWCCYSRFPPRRWPLSTLPVAEQSSEIVIRGKEARTWEQGSYEVWHIRGGAEIRQGKVVARAAEGIFWIDRAEAFSGRPSKVIAYLEGSGGDKVSVEFGPREIPRPWECKRFVAHRPDVARPFPHRGGNSNLRAATGQGWRRWLPPSTSAQGCPLSEPVKAASHPRPVHPAAGCRRRDCPSSPPSIGSPREPSRPLLSAVHWSAGNLQSFN